MQSVYSNSVLISGTSHVAIAQEVATILEIPLGNVSIETFPDGEKFVQINENVRGRDVFVFQSVARDPDIYLIELLIIIDALRRASAQSITAVIPYFGYCRQDRKDRPRVSIAAKLVANMLTQAGASRILTMDLHVGQVQGFFDIPVDNLAGRPILVNAFIQHTGHKINDHDVVVVTPDIGGVKVARAYAAQLKAEMAIIDKLRISPTKVNALSIIGEVKGKDVLLADDLVSTGETLVSAAKACREKGAKRIFAVVTHGLLVGESIQKIEQSPIEALLISNTVRATTCMEKCRKIKIVSIAELIGQAIRCITTKESISSLYDLDFVNTPVC